MTLIQAQQRFIETRKTAANKRVRVGARLTLTNWAKRHGYDVEVVLNDARDMLELEVAAR